MYVVNNRNACTTVVIANIAALLLNSLSGCYGVECFCPLLLPFVILLSAHENLFHFHSFFSFQVEKKENKIYRAHVSLSTWDSYALRQKKTLSAQKFTQKNKFDEKRVENRAAK